MGKCNNCGKNEGKSYTFYYGNRVGQSESPIIGSKSIRVTMHYDICGNKDEVVCDECVNTRRKWHRIIGITGGILLIAGGIVMQFFIPSQKGVISMFCFLKIAPFIGALILIVFAIAKGTGSEDREIFGEEIAIILNRKVLKKDYKEFWTATRYTEMRKKSLGL
jgi:hypothetical protein